MTRGWEQFANYKRVACRTHQLDESSCWSVSFCSTAISTKKGLTPVLEVSPCCSHIISALNRKVLQAAS
jgi:hypothetical protein